MTLFLFLSFYVVMVLAALCVEGIFVLLNWLPSSRGAAVAQAAISFNYTPSSLSFSDCRRSCYWLSSIAMAGRK